MFNRGAERYSFGCKRPTLSNDYYRAFTEDQVALEDYEYA